MQSNCPIANKLFFTLSLDKKATIRNGKNISKTICSKSTISVAEQWNSALHIEYTNFQSINSFFSNTNKDYA
jgi:hypothetical protein